MNYIKERERRVGKKNFSEKSVRFEDFEDER